MCDPAGSRRALLYVEGLKSPPLNWYSFLVSGSEMARGFGGRLVSWLACFGFGGCFKTFFGYSLYRIRQSDGLF